MYKVVSIHTRSTYWSNKESSEELIVDSDDLSHEIEMVANNHYKEGFEIISIIPINSGSMTNGNGYYQTESVIMTFKKRT
jgi:hypothetical protein